MKRTFLKKSQVLREGYIKGLRQAQRIINEMLEGEDETSLGEHLVVAAQRGDIDKCEQLLKDGADVNFKTKYGYTPLHCAAEEGDTEICELLINNGADVDADDGHGVVPLHLAVDYGHFQTCVLLLKNRADANAKSEYNYTPLSLAKKNGDVKLIRLLHYHGA